MFTSSIESSNRIDGITVSSRRFDSIMKDNSQPKDRSEAEIAGYRDVLLMIHERYSYIQIRSNTILQLHRDLMPYVDSGQGARISSIPPSRRRKCQRRIRVACLKLQHEKAAFGEIPQRGDTL
jgi:hypothetical protein